VPWEGAPPNGKKKVFGKRSRRGYARPGPYEDISLPRKKNDYTANLNGEKIRDPREKGRILGCVGKKRAPQEANPAPNASGGGARTGQKENGGKEKRLGMLARGKAEWRGRRVRNGGRLE